MSVDTYKLIKNQNGEAFAQAIRNHHSGILEIKDIVDILRYAGHGAEDAKGLLPYLTSLLSIEEKPACDTLDPFELLSRAGYDAFYADTLEKQNSIRRYFAKGELLCTFNSASRYQNYYIIHAVKKNVDDIKRVDFVAKKSRQDDYGTSVISIQIYKSGRFIKITNRYNHTVDNADNTFNSNPDNIIDGLSAALKHYFKVDFTTSQSPVPDGFMMVGDQIFKHHHEQNNIFYGDQAWFANGVIKEVERKKGDALFDAFYFDNKTKTMRAIDPKSDDSFPEVFNRYYGGDKNLHVRNGHLMLGDEVLIGAENSKIKTITLNKITEVGNNFLKTLPHATHITMNALKTMGSDCLTNLPFVTSITMNALQKMESNCLTSLPLVTSITMNALQTMGSQCFKNAKFLKVVNMIMLEKMGNYCFHDVPFLTFGSFDALKTMGNDCFKIASALPYISMNKLENIGNRCFYTALTLSSCSFDALKTMGNNCFYMVDLLEKISMSSLQSTRNNCFVKCAQLKEAYFPLLTQLGSQTFTNSPRNLQFVAPKLLNIPRHLRSLILKNSTNRNPRRHLLQT